MSSISLKRNKISNYFWNKNNAKPKNGEQIISNLNAFGILMILKIKITNITNNAAAPLPLASVKRNANNEKNNAQKLNNLFP